MYIDIDYLLNLKRQIDNINKEDLNDLIFYENGKKIKIDNKILKQWKYIGLNNFDFITSKFYKDGFVQND